MPAIIELWFFSSEKTSQGLSSPAARIRLVNQEYWMLTLAYCESGMNHRIPFCVEMNARSQPKQNYP